MDHLGPFVTSARGNKYVFAIVDNLTKFAYIRAVKDTKTTSVLRILNEFVRECGAPVRIISDRGTSFTSKAFENFCDRHGIKHTMNSPRHPQANGQVERLNATLVPAIRSSLEADDGRTWDKRIQEIQSDVNEMGNATTGKSPFELVYGYVPRRDEGEVRKCSFEEDKRYRQPAELQEEARKNICIAQGKMKSRYDKGRAKSTELNEGSVVFMKSAPTATGESTKLQPKYRGPLVIIKRLPSDTYHVADLNDGAEGRRYAATAHASQLKLWKPSNSESDDGSDSEEESSGEEEAAEREVPAEEPANGSNDVISISENTRVEKEKKSESELKLRSLKRQKRAPVRFEDYEL